MCDMIRCDQCGDLLDPIIDRWCRLWLGEPDKECHQICEACAGELLRQLQEAE